MKRSFFTSCILLSLIATSAIGQTVDTLVDVGTYRLHFHIVKGKGVPILFDAGGGNDGTVWYKILQPIADITGATLITYDRAGFGKSEIDTSKTEIRDGIIGLETSLKKLGYNGDIMLVAHSLGGFYATLYASRHASEVKAAVLVDINVISFFTDEHNRNSEKEKQAEMDKYRNVNPGIYYLMADLKNTIDVMRKVSFPLNIPAIDLVSDMTPLKDSVEAVRWKTCHREFADASPEREGIIAYGTGHYIFYSNPELVIDAIVKQYAKIVSKPARYEILERAFVHTFQWDNESKREEAKYQHSEDDLNSWGYSLLQKGDKEKALEVFKLNTLLNPASSNVYDSEAEAYESIGDKALAIKYYKRSLELNPGNTNAKEHLKRLSDDAR